MTLIELLFAPILLIAVPLALARLDPEPHLMRRVAWPAATMLAVALFLAPSPIAVLLALPWLALTVALAVGGLAELARTPAPWRPGRRLALAIAFGFVAFGAANAISFAAGFGPLGFAPIIILLTAVHFHAAGFVVMTAGILAWDRRPSRIAAGGVAGVAAGSVVTAAGFLGVPGAAAVGAVTVALGGLFIGWATIGTAAHLASVWAGRVSIVAGAALFVSMPLAIIWAVGPVIGIEPFGLDLMIRTHGAINALAVCVPISVGWALDAR